MPFQLSAQRVEHFRPVKGNRPNPLALFEDQVFVTQRFAPGFSWRHYRSRYEHGQEIRVGLDYLSHLGLDNLARFALYCRRPTSSMSHGNVASKPCVASLRTRHEYQLSASADSIPTVFVYNGARSSEAKTASESNEVITGSHNRWREPWLHHFQRSRRLAWTRWQ